MKTDFPEHPVESHRILVAVLLLMICTTEAKKREMSYKVLSKGDIIRGTTSAEFNVRSGLECSLR